MRSLLPCLFLVAMALACRSQPFGEIDRGNAATHIEQAQAAIDAGEHQRALEHLAQIHEVSGLDPDLRAQEQRLIDEASRARFEQLSEASPEELEAIFKSKLPDRVRAQAGIRAAERYLADERRITAYRLVKKVDETIPGHHERVLAGDIVARAGLSMIDDGRRYNLLFRYRPRGAQALEYLILRYPLDARCAEAYFALSEFYEREGDLDQSIERTENLLLYHPESPYASGASARLPYLRLYRLKRDDYDRGELLRAQSELEHWLAHNADHELREWVLGLQRDCRLRLVRSDLYLATFYERTGTPVGQEWHARRAHALALEGSFQKELAQATKLLPPPPDDGPPTTIPQP